MLGQSSNNLRYQYKYGKNGGDGMGGGGAGANGGAGLPYGGFRDFNFFVFNDPENMFGGMGNCKVFCVSYGDS